MTDDRLISERNTTLIIALIKSFEQLIYISTGNDKSGRNSCYKAYYIDLNEIYNT